MINWSPIGPSLINYKSSKIVLALNTLLEMTRKNLQNFQLLTMDSSNKQNEISFALGDRLVCGKILVMQSNGEVKLPIWVCYMYYTTNFHHFPMSLQTFFTALLARWLLLPNRRIPNFLEHVKAQWGKRQVKKFKQCKMQFTNFYQEGYVMYGCVKWQEKVY